VISQLSSAIKHLDLRYCLKASLASSQLRCESALAVLAGMRSATCIFAPPPSATTAFLPSGTGQPRLSSFEMSTQCCRSVPIGASGYKNKQRESGIFGFP
jgi:hypothetical protein